jgi:hypothetical protein
VFNAIMLHQLAENPNLIYCILRTHKRFEDLGTFTLGKGLREIQRIKLAKEEAERLRTGKEKGKAMDNGSGTLSAHESLASLALSEDSQTQEKGISTRDSSEAGLRRSQSEDNSGQPLNTPTMPIAAGQPGSVTEGRAIVMSEKARGKMREDTTSPPIDLDPELQRVAAAGVGRNGFVPTQEWVASWQQG